MTNKAKIILGILVILLLVIIGSVTVYNKACLIPTDEAIKEASQNRKNPIFNFLYSLSSLVKTKTNLCNLHKPTSKEKAEIIAKKKADPGFVPSPGSDKAPSPPKLGVQAAIDPTILGKNLIPDINSWVGNISGDYIVAAGTAETDNPAQGVLFIWEPDKGITSSRTYLAPSATGPLKIVSEENNVLTLQSVAGTYEVYDINTDTRHYVTTPGGTIYTFDVTQRVFK